MSDFRNDTPRTGAGTGTSATTASANFDPHAEITALREKVDNLMKERVSPAIGSAVDSAEAAAHRATDAVRHQAENLEEFVHEKPMMALASAALAGFVFALLVRR